MYNIWWLLGRGVRQLKRLFILCSCSIYGANWFIHRRSDVRFGLVNEAACGIKWFEILFRTSESECQTGEREGGRLETRVVMNNTRTHWGWWDVACAALLMCCIHTFLLRSQGEITCRHVTDPGARHWLWLCEHLPPTYTIHCVSGVLYTTAWCAFV